MSATNLWHVLRSKPHKEDSLFRFVTAEGYRVFYPQIPANPVNPRARKIQSYFPGYMFVHACLADIGQNAFQYLPFSMGLIWLGGEPAVVLDRVVHALQTRLAEIWDAGGLTCRDLEPGQRVIIQEGVFEGYEGIFDAYLSGNARVQILLKMLNDRFVPMEIDRALVAKVQHREGLSAR
ncbi:MAG: transcription termination/antitermination NusG family protein [Anaerolineales bacterium]